MALIFTAKKLMHTGQYTHFSSFELTAWANSLFHRAFIICNNKTYSNNQIEMIKSFMSRNGYPEHKKFPNS